MKKTTHTEKSIQTTRSRAWLLTLFCEIGNRKYTADDVKSALTGYRYVFQLEKAPTTERLHWQIYLEADNPVKGQTILNKLPGSHIEVARKREDAALYCAKQKTAEGERYVSGLDLDALAVKKADQKTHGYDAVISDVALGVPRETLIFKYPSICARSMRWVDELYKVKKLSDWKVDMKKVQQEFRDIEVHYLYGASGVGKTRSVFAKYGSSAFYMPHYKNGCYDGYSGQPVLVLDEFRSQIDFSFLLKLLDGYPLVLPARYNDKIACYSTVWVISNRSLSEQYTDIKRSDITSWRALLRRFSTVEQMNENGETITINTKEW